MADVVETAETTELAQSEERGEAVPVEAEESVEEVTEQAPAEATDEPVEAVDAGSDEPTEEGDDDVVAAPEPTSPYDLPGDWYVIHSYS
ncbi:MAG TPA: transcription termination/antitermination factor NusG, partial [Acidimicrobiia bacterium]|nr:transcription termination/antitermination factor NusG [Acidimicrobiia bacterium]